MDLQEFRDKRAAGLVVIGDRSKEETIEIIRSQFDCTRQVYKKHGFLYTIFSVNTNTPEAPSQMWLKWMLDEQYDAYTPFTSGTVTKVDLNKLEKRVWTMYFFPRGTTDEEVQFCIPNYKLITKQ